MLGVKGANDYGMKPEVAERSRCESFGSNRTLGYLEFVLRPCMTRHRIFSSLAGAGLCDTIGRYMYLFEGLTAVFGGRFYRFEHIVPYSSSKVIAK